MGLATRAARPYIGQDQRGAMGTNRALHGRQIEAEVGRERYTCIAQPNEASHHPKHDERGFRGEQRRTRAVHRQGQNMDQLVRAVAEQQLQARGNGHDFAQARLERRDREVRIAVERRLG